MMKHPQKRAPPIDKICTKEKRAVSVLDRNPIIMQSPIQIIKVTVIAPNANIVFFLIAPIIYKLKKTKRRSIIEKAFSIER